MNTTTKPKKKAITFYAEVSIQEFVDTVAAANEGISKNFIGGKILKLGIEAYKQKLDANLKVL